MAANITIQRFLSLVTEGRIIFNDGPMSLFEARHEESRNEPDRKVLWTDASALGHNVGLAVVWKQDFNEDLQHLAAPGEQEWTEHYFVSSRAMGSGSGEREAVLAALDIGESLFAPGMVGDIIVYTDAGMRDIKNPGINGAFLNPIGRFATKAAIRAAELAIKGFTVEFKCCRGHMSILGNELADYWARMAIGLDRPGLTTDDWARAHQAVRERDERRLVLRQQQQQMETDWAEFEAFAAEDE